jgi:hypothetical protein
MKNIKKIAEEIIAKAKISRPPTIKPWHSEGGKAVHKVVQKVKKKIGSYLTGEQQQKIEQALSSEINVMSFQEMAKQLAPQIKANEMDIYDWLQNNCKNNAFKGRIQ